MTVDIASPEHKANPYPFYARLRAESPVFPVTLPDKQTAWLITRYDDVVAALKDKRFAKDKLNALSPEQAARQPWVPEFFRPLTRNMLDLDEPDHTRLRALVNKAFTPRLVEGIRDRIQTLSDGLLTAVQGQESIDLIRDYALPIATTIIAEMLGVPAPDRHKFSRWSKGIVAANSSRWGVVRAIPKVWRVLRYIRIVYGVPKLIDFLKRAFDAEEKHLSRRPDGAVMHAQLRIGDSFVMMGEAQVGFPPMPGSLYLYVTDTDAVYRRALEAGGTSVMEPADQFYGDRNAGVKDPSGNIWWLATHQEDVSDDELNKRAQEYFTQKEQARG